jgi:hypothetical protein
MGLTELILGTRKASIGLVELDASVRELHRTTATVTRHPVEASTGEQTSITDHVRIDPLSIRIEGIITNTPAEWVAALQNFEKDRDVQEFLELQSSMLAGERVTIKTTLREYSDMVLESIEVTRDASKGNALYFVATATQVRLVTLQETEVAADRPVTKSTRKKGKKPAAQADSATSTSARSGLSKLLF